MSAKIDLAELTGVDPKLADLKAELMTSLRRLKGRGTVGDVATESGLPTEDVRSGLKALLESHQGHLAVSDSGELLYEFDPRLIERGREPWLHRAKRAVGKFLRGAFKAWIVVMLVAYFVIFVALLIAAVFANQRGRDSRGGGWGGHRHRGGGVGFPNFWFWYWIWGPRWRVGRPYYGHRWERTLDKEDKVPFYKKVFAFVFGPDRPEPTRAQLDRGLLRLIRARAGVLTTAELVEHSGTTFPAAEQEMARLLGSYGGEALVSPDGELVYAFPEIMATASEARRVRPPNPAWLRLEPALELTGNTSGANAVVAGMNGFTLLSAATAPWFIFPRLGLGGTAAYLGLVWVPVVFSAVFFAIPLVRSVSVKLENRRRHTRNVRRVLLGLVYRRALETSGPVGVGEAHAYVASKLTGQSVDRGDVEAALHRLAAELDADVTVDEGGEQHFAFPALRRAFVAADAVRRKLELDEKTLGEIVYATSDTTEQAEAREARLFERALESEKRVDVDRYLPSPDRIGFEEDFEVVAFDEELRRPTDRPERIARRPRG
ncbi:MAG: hypothetical protein AB7T31_12810 [Gemmatimonadales bacterium]